MKEENERISFDLFAAASASAVATVFIVCAFFCRVKSTWNKKFRVLNWMAFEIEDTPPLTIIFSLQIEFVAEKKKLI